MFATVAVASLFVSGPEWIDWTRATDDMRWALLKPVMSRADVDRLRVGKEDFAEGCGQAKDEAGNLVGAYIAHFSYKLSGRTEPVTISFTVRDVCIMGPMLDELRPSAWSVGFGGTTYAPPPAPKRLPPNLVAFRADEVLYLRDKDGRYVAQPKKK